MVKFFYQPVLYEISSFLAPSFSLRGKCNQKAVVSWSRKASAADSWHLSISGMQSSLPVTWGPSACPGTTLRVVQNSIKASEQFPPDHSWFWIEVPPGSPGRNHTSRVRNKKQMSIWNRPSHPGASQDVCINQERAPQQITALLLCGKAFDGWLVMAKNEANP